MRTKDVHRYGVRRRQREVGLVVVAVAISLALVGCTAASPGKSAASTPKSTVSSALDALQPVMPKKFTEAAAKKTTDDLAKQIDSLVASTDTVYIDNHEKLIAATSTSAATYGVIRTINVSPSLDPLQQAEAMEKLLVAAGWKLEDSTSATGKYLAAMSSSTDPSKAWFLLLGGDSTVAKQPVVTVQLASPDIAKK